MSRALFGALFVLLAGCSLSDPWSQDGLIEGDGSFASKRLSYTPLAGHPPWRLEFFRDGDELGVFLSLVQHRFHALDAGVKVKISVAGEVFEEWTPVFAGGMKIKLSQRLTNTLILALQEGKKVSILVGEWEEAILAGSFKRKFTKLMDDSREWLLIQTPLK